MILPRHQARLVAEGKATLAILPVTEYRPLDADFKAHNRIAREVAWIRGEWRDDDGKLQRTDVLCQVVIGKVIRTDLHKVTLQQARLAGFDTRGDLAQWWRERYERVPAPASTDPWPESYPLEVRTIPLSLDVPVMLSRGGGFTTRTDSLNAGECVPHDYRGWLAEKAVEQDDLRRLARQRREQAQRLEELYAEAERSGVDVSRMAARVQRELDAMDRKLRRNAA